MRSHTILAVVTLIPLTHSDVLGQAPIVQPANVLNAASILSVSQQGVAPQMLLAIGGQNLAASTAQWDGANGLAPMTLAGTSVTFNGVAAPLLYVSPSQINLEVPATVAGEGTADLVVTTTAGSSVPVALAVNSRSFGVFTQDFTGCGAGSVFNVHYDGSMEVNTTLDSFDPQQDAALAVFFTGLGGFADVKDGVPWSYNSGDNLASGGTQAIVPIFGIPGIQQNQPLKLLYAGPAPGDVGVDQVNVVHYDTAELFQGCKVPLYVANYNGNASQLVNISVHNGGGACVEPPADTLGLVTWQKTTTSDANSTLSTESVQVQFLGGQQLLLPAAPTVGGITCCIALATPPLNCEAAVLASLDAGALTVSGVTAAPISLTPQDRNGIGLYSVALPVGAIEGGAYRIVAAGGQDVGAFSATATIAAPIAITAAPLPGSTLVLPSEVTWTGGDDLSAIDITLKVTTSLGLSTIDITSLASAGSLTIPESACFSLLPCPVPSGGVEILITQQPVGGSVGLFSATGLNEGGAQTWNYVWDFKGLKH